jgi:glutathione peroxidase
MLSFRQKIAKFMYPLIMKLKRDEKGKSLFNTTDKKPVNSFFDLKATANNGKEISMNEYKGKKIMLVNVASNCGYTGQYDELEKIYQENKDRLVILGFPSNDFAKQEAGSDKEIEQFCRLNFGVTFPLFKKHPVLKPAQEPIYQWLSDEKQNGWNNQEPVWNFSKYIIDENGTLNAFYGPSISPLSDEIKKSLK